MNAHVTLCQASLAQHSKSFALATRLLPKGAADAAAVVYAWCRRADDAIDFSTGSAQRQALDRLREELAHVYAGVEQTDAVLAAFQAVVEQCGIPYQYPSDLLDGMQMDVCDQSYHTWDDLLAYCYRVAGSVGLTLCHVMGVSDRAALRHAAHLGIAMQLTNICRDVAEDWQRGRLYLPARVLARHGARPERWQVGCPLTTAASEECRGPLRELLGVADRYYASSDLGLSFLPYRSAIAVGAARRIYSAIGRELARRDYDVLAPRAHVSTRKKLWACSLAALTTSLGRLHHIGSRFEPAPLHTVTLGPELLSL
jgi:phytoene synthase